MINKNAQSQIIGTVLLILIVIAATVILANYIIPWVSELLNRNKGCLETIGNVKIETGKYTCYNSSANEMYVQVHIGETAIKGFKIELVGATSKVVEITSGKNGEPYNVSMYRDGWTLSLPEASGAITYKVSQISEKPDAIKVYPILDDNRICDASDIINEVDNCFEV